MRCRKCEYRLWNLTSRQCPECGEAFTPSEFEFIPSSVRFCCPHCNQEYYGTGPKGHLVPIEFECVGCGQHVHMDEMVLLPAEGVEEESTSARLMPWLNRQGRNVLAAWGATVGSALVAPGRLMRVTPGSGPVGEAWYFALLTHCMILVAGLIPVCFFFLVMSGFMAAAPGGGPPVAGMIGGLACTGLGVLVGVMFMIALWGVLSHGLLRITGRTESGIARTYQAICYSSGANVASAVPCVGYYFGWVWWLVSAVLMVREAQKVHGARAAFAVLTLPVVLVVGGVSTYIWTITWAMTAGAGATPFGTPFDSTQVILDALLQYADERDGFPLHAVELVSGDYLEGFDLVSTGSDTFEEHVRFAGTNLEKFQQSSETLQKRAITRASQSLPPGTIAHRLGDYVLTYHGIDLTTADSRLWLVIMSPDPRANPGGKSVAGFLRVGRVDGTVIQIPETNFAQQVASQNQLRARAGLLPLPDPSSVTHTAPAVAKAESSVPVEDEKGEATTQPSPERTDAP